MRSAQRGALREINVDTLVSTLKLRGRHQRDRLVTLRREKQCCFSENTTREQRGSKPGRMHDGRGSQELYPLRHVPFSLIAYCICEVTL